MKGIAYERALGHDHRLPGRSKPSLRPGGWVPQWPRGAVCPRGRSPRSRSRREDCACKALVAGGCCPELEQVPGCVGWEGKPLSPRGNLGTRTAWGQGKPGHAPAPACSLRCLPPGPCWSLQALCVCSWRPEALPWHDRDSGTSRLGDLPKLWVLGRGSRPLICGLESFLPVPTLSTKGTPQSGEWTGGESSAGF